MNPERVRGVRGGDDVGLRVIAEAAVADVGRDAVVEEHDVLADERDVRAQAREPQLEDVDAVDQDAPVARLVETREQVRERRLAAARGAHERDRLARRDAERDLRERGPRGARVGKAHPLELDLAARPADLDRAAVGLRLLVDQPEHRLGRGEAALHRLVHVREPLDRRHQHEERGQVGHEPADRRLVARRLADHEVDDRRHRERRDEVRRRDGRRGGGRDLHLEPAHLVGGLREAAALVLLSAEHLHHAMTADRLLEHVVEIAHCRLLGAAHPAQAAGEVARDPGDRRADDDREQRQLPVEPQHPAEQAHDRERVLHDHVHRAGRGAGHLRDVVGELGDGGAGGRGVVVRGRQPHERAEHGSAQIDDQLLRDPLDHVPGDERRDPAHQEQADDGDRHPAHQRVVPFDERPVEQRLDERRQPGLGRRDDDHREDGGKEPAPVGLDVAEEAEIEPEARGRARIRRVRSRGFEAGGFEDMSGRIISAALKRPRRGARGRGRPCARPSRPNRGRAPRHAHPCPSRRPRARPRRSSPVRARRRRGRPRRSR